MSSPVCIVRHRDYPGDARIENQVQALVDAGYDVDVLCMRRPGEPYLTIENSVRLYRLPSLKRQREGKLRYVAEYLTFFALSFLIR